MSSPSLLRPRGDHDAPATVGTIELFFDLVFVFAITQLSHSLVAHLDAVGALQTGMLLVGVWWVWIFTSWVTNWLDPGRLPVRFCLFALMLAGLVMSTSIPKAFGDHGLAFACAYVAMQVGRTLFFLWAVRGESRERRRNFQRILAWLSLSAVFWLAGGASDGGARMAWWGAALLVESTSAAVFFWVPGLGRSSVDDWDVDGHHLSERCGLFVIIALGESLLVTGATSARLGVSAETAIAFLSAFVGCVAMWWMYFDTGAGRATAHFTRARDPGRVARIAYTYLHLPIVAGIIVCAVADELLLTHPGHASDAAIAVILGGPALYVLGNALFKWVTNRRPLPPISHLGGLVALLVLVPFAHDMSALQLGVATTTVLVAVAAWEAIALRRSTAPASGGRPAMPEA